MVRGVMTRACMCRRAAAAVHVRACWTGTVEKHTHAQRLQAPRLVHAVPAQHSHLCCVSNACPTAPARLTSYTASRSSCASSPYAASACTSCALKRAAVLLWRRPGAAAPCGCCSCPSSSATVGRTCRRRAGGAGWCVDGGCQAAGSTPGQSAAPWPRCTHLRRARDAGNRPGQRCGMRRSVVSVVLERWREAQYRNPARTRRR